MKRFLFAVAAVALSAAVGFAEDKPAAAAPATPATPVIVGTYGTPVAEYAPAAPTTARRGLFSRFRNRNATSTTTTYSPPAPLTTTITPGTVITPTAPTPMPPVAPAPMPMPGAKPAGATLMPTPNGTIVMTGGTVTGEVMPATYTEPAAPARRGLFGRLRNR